ncbi:MAG TPA: PCYCGC motif-containing (lipo)protein [Verrucomicrobiae bacterium]|nr:PCYCGC motif-containing (lipo)protein [Verrucomicrobiae bacterium]
MKPRNVILAVLAVVVVVAVFLANRSGERAAPESTTPAAPQQGGAGSTQPATSPTPSTEAPGATEEVTEQNIPHFHASLEEAGPLPRILPASNFRIPVVARAYRVAARIPEVLAQQPCYCWCDKIGHGSLVDCFATDHGAG